MTVVVHDDNSGESGPVLGDHGQRWGPGYWDADARRRRAAWAVGSGDAGLKYPESSMGTSALSSPLAELQSRLPELMLRDQRRLRRRLDGVRRMRSRAARQKIAAEIAADVERAERARRRRAARPCPR